MTTSLEGKDVSLWVASTPQTNYPTLANDNNTYDLVVVGGGITGVATAYFAQKSGRKTALIEKARLVEWTTGGTTAKLSSQHYLIYDYLLDRHGRPAAQAFADANQAGIDMVESLSEQLDIDSEFARRAAYVYTNQDDKVEAIKSEVEAAKSLGLPASFETTTELPVDVVAAIKFDQQAEFHPRKFLLGLVDEFRRQGGVVYEQTEASDINPGQPHTIKTKSGEELRASHVVQASGLPFWQGDILDGRMWEKASYALAATLKNPADYPQHMYITTDDPMRTIRSASYQDKPVLIFGGESHEYDDATFDPDKHYKILIDDLHKRYSVDKVLFRWLASDFMPYDRMPYIGTLPHQPTIYLATGYRAWGLAWAMSAAQAIVDDINGQPPAWVKHFDLDRLSQPVRSTDKQSRID